MITEDYVSFETAKLLKEKGFEGQCSVKQVCTERNHNEGSEWTTESEVTVDIPTLQMAMKWLEEVHHIIVVADYEYECTDTSWYYKVYRLGKNGKPERCTVVGARYGNDEEGFLEEIVAYRDYDRSHEEYSTRKEACEAAIKHCIENLI